MKVTQKHFQDEKNYGEREKMTLEINGKRVFGMGAGEPEDMTLRRDLSDAWSVPRLMKAAYEAGKQGESFEFESLYVDDWEDLY